MEPDDPLIDGLLAEALMAAWKRVNWSHFKNALTPPVLRLDELGSHLGQWHAASRTLTIARDFCRTAPWGHVLEVLYHELAHQYVSEVLRVTDETDHGPAFRRVCDQLGLDPRASGLAGGVPGEEGPVLRRIRKLLALAGSPNQHEAEAAMKAAHRMMLQHNVELQGQRERDGYTIRHLGTPRARHAAWEKLLFGILSAHFFVRIVWVEVVDRSRVQNDGWGRPKLRRTRVAEALGTPANLEIAEYVHAFLAETGARLWRTHKRAAGLTGDKERARYLAGVMIGFRRKLQENVAQCVGEGLVWTGDPALADFVGRRYPRLVYGGPLSVASTPEFKAGIEAGREIVLHKPVAAGPSGDVRRIGKG